MENDTKDQLNEDYVSIPRLLKGVVVRSDRIGAELTKEQQLLGDKFAEFVRTQLPFDLREAQLFMALAATPGLEAAKFTPAVEVKLPRLLEVFCQVVGVWSTINDGIAPENAAGTAVASDVVPCPNCEGSADALVTNGGPQDATDDTAAASDIASVTGAMPPVLGNEIAISATELTVPAGDVVVRDNTADPAVPDILAGTANTDSQGTAPTAVEELVVHQPAITAEQRKFLAERSVTLLVKVRKGELSVEEAMRQAVGLPIRKAQKETTL